MSWEVITFSHAALSSQVGCYTAPSTMWSVAAMQHGFRTQNLATVHDTVFDCSCFSNLMQLSYFAFPETPQTLVASKPYDNFMEPC